DVQRERGQRRAQLVRGDGEKLVARFDSTVSLGDGGPEKEGGDRRNRHEQLYVEERVGQRRRHEGTQAHRRARDGDGGDDEDRDDRAVLPEAERRPGQRRKEHVRMLEKALAAAEDEKA